MRRRDIRIPRRFLLDQNFPAPRFAPADVDASVQYVPLHEFNPSLTQGQTPDWLIYAEAELVGTFTGVVTRDVSQIEQEEELVMLTATSLSVVTWREPIEDAIAEWGQLIAYMPLILDRIEREGPRIFLLPRPVIRVGHHVRKASQLLIEIAKRESTAVREIRHSAVRAMRAEIEARDRDELAALVEEAGRPRPSPGLKQRHQSE